MQLQRSALLGLAVLTLPLGGCVERLGNIGRPPQLSNLKHEDLPSTTREAPRKGPTGLPGAASATHVPDAAGATGRPSRSSGASLWRSTAPRYFTDQRARGKGDILTVTFDVDDSAMMENETTRDRESSEQMGVGAFLGYEQALSDVFPEGIEPDDLASASGTSEYEGTGETDREEDIEFEMAAMVVDVLPNGHFVIRGRQQIRVNYELRDLQVSGIVRPADIGDDNSISYEEIAEVRVSYGGRGDLTNMQQPRYGQQVLDVILPF
jgi:flagellar L-ring protein precursor FlgH